MTCRCPFCRYKWCSRNLLKSELQDLPPQSRKIGSQESISPIVVIRNHFAGNWLVNRPPSPAPTAPTRLGEPVTRQTTSLRRSDLTRPCPRPRTPKSRLCGLLLFREGLCLLVLLKREDVKHAPNCRVGQGVSQTVQPSLSTPAHKQHKFLRLLHKSRPRITGQSTSPPLSKASLLACFTLLSTSDEMNHIATRATSYCLQQ